MAATAAVTTTTTTTATAIAPVSSSSGPSYTSAHKFNLGDLHRERLKRAELQREQERIEDELKVQQRQQSRAAMSDGRAVVQNSDFRAALDSFIPSAQGLEKEMQELVAVLECTDRSFLPPDWQEKVGGPDGRVRLQERLVAVRQLIDQV